MVVNIAVIPGSKVSLSLLLTAGWFHNWTGDAGPPIGSFVATAMTNASNGATTLFPIFAKAVA